LNAKELQEARAVAEEAVRRAAERERKVEEDDEDTDTEHSSQDDISSEEDISKVARAEEETKVMDQDPRTRILNVLELENLFISSAPDLESGL
jgi:large subunit GTPase 1